MVGRCCIALYITHKTAAAPGAGGALLPGEQERRGERAGARYPDGAATVVPTLRRAVQVERTLNTACRKSVRGGARSSPRTMNVRALDAVVFQGLTPAQFERTRSTRAPPRPPWRQPPAHHERARPPRILAVVFQNLSSYHRTIERATHGCSSAVSCTGSHSMFADV